MSLPTSLHAYEAEIESFEKAAAADKGIRLQFDNRADAAAYMARMHQARILDRRKNMETYDKGHPMYGASEFDKLKCYVREDTEGKFWVYVAKNETFAGVVEELP